MGFIDIVLLVIVGSFVLFGFFFGFVHTLGSLIGSIVGIFLTTRLIDPAFNQFGFIFGGGNAARVIIFIILFMLISRLVGIVFWFLGKIWDVLSFIPFAKSFDRLLGGIFGCIEGIVIVGVLIFYAKYLVATASALQVLLPEGLKAAKQAAEEGL